MISILSQVSDFLFTILRFILILIMIIMAVVITCNSFGRYFLDSSIYWAEEVTRYAFVWSAFLGAACAYKNRGLVSMSVIMHRLSPSMRKIAELSISTVIGVFLLISFGYGTQLTLAVANQRSASLEISMSLVYLCLPISFFCMIVFNLEQLLILAGKHRNLPIWGEDWT